MGDIDDVEFLQGKTTSNEWNQLKKEDMRTANSKITVCVWGGGGLPKPFQGPLRTSGGDVAHTLPSLVFALLAFSLASIPSL